MRNIAKFILLLSGLFTLILSGCGSGGDVPNVNVPGGNGGSGGNVPTVNTPGNGGGGGGWVAGVYEPETTYLNYCESPRVGSDPVTGYPYPDMQGSTLSENNWLRSWSNNTYLWYNEIVDRDPALYTTTAYFDLLKTSATTSSGTAKDQFHFTYPTEEWEQLSQSGVSAGYGAEWAIIKAVPPREVRVAFTEPGSPATSVSIARGAEILQVDNVDVVYANDQASIDILNGALFPAGENETHTFVVQDLGSSVTRTVSMT